MPSLTPDQKKYLFTGIAWFAVLATGGLWIWQFSGKIETLPVQDGFCRNELDEKGKEGCYTQFQATSHWVHGLIKTNKEFLFPNFDQWMAAINKALLPPCEGNLTLCWNNRMNGASTMLGAMFVMAELRHDSQINALIGVIMGLLLAVLINNTYPLLFSLTKRAVEAAKAWRQNYPSIGRHRSFIHDSMTIELEEEEEDNTQPLLRRSRPQ